MLMTTLLLLWNLVFAIAAPGVAPTAGPAVVTPAPPIDPAPFQPETLATGFATERSAFAVTFGDQPVRHRTMGVFALPGEVVRIVAESGGHATALRTETGELEPGLDGAWNWRAPAAPGTARLELVRRADGETVGLHVFVMVPYEEMERGAIRGYPVGPYPEPRARHAERDARPRGFIEVTAATAGLPVSPHFRLGQFVCKAGAGYPKYVVIQPRLLLRLESLLETVNRRGIEAPTFALMSAYRTPAYNRRIGNSTTFTRHQYGDAADIYVDHAPADGAMDDLNRDGRVDRADALTLHQWAEETEGEAPENLAGGLSAYRANDAHGPFVHIDTRGVPARW